MKKSIILIVILFFFGSLTAQEFKIGDIIQFKAPARPVGTDVNITKSYDEATKTQYLLERNVKFIIIDNNDNKYKIEAIPFLPLKKENAKQRDKSDYYNSKIFTLEKNEFISKAIIPPDKWSIGLLSLPFKFRPQDDKSFDTEFNLNSTLNYRIGNFWGTDLHAQIGAGIGSVGLNTNNAPGLEEGKAQDIATLAMLAGVMLQFKKVQAGLYIGVDHINNNDNYNWKSNGNVWFGFGVGYELFKISLTDNSSQKQ